MDVIERAAVDRLLDALKRRGYRIVGPRLRDGAVALGEIGSTAELPEGWVAEQEPGRYRLRRDVSAGLFGVLLGGQSWKSQLFPPRVRVFKAERSAGSLCFREDEGDAPDLALFGIRSCDLTALLVLERVFSRRTWTNPDYRRRLDACFIVAVGCTRPAATCFCASMGAGPAPLEGFDIALTELKDDGDHVFAVAARTALGVEVLAEVPHRPATSREAARLRRDIEEAPGRMGRGLAATKVAQTLPREADSSRWDAVGARCLTCGCCTLVCPTCFCSEFEDTVSVDALRAERHRVWASCFSLDFTWMGGGPVRQSPGSRYRQWISHKLSRWREQFGTPGCVGCGRCITWCPVGIDITEEAGIVCESGSGSRGGSP